MATHEADLSGRSLEVLRQALGLDPVGGESFPVPIVEWHANIKKDIFFIGAVGEIALLGTQYFTVPPDKAGLVLHFSNCLWRELQLNDRSRAQYQKLQRVKGDLYLCGPFGSVVLVTHSSKRRQHALSLKSTKGMFAVILNGSAYLTHAGHCTALAHPRVFFLSRRRDDRGG